jgi:hypothetical protein
LAMNNSNNSGDCNSMLAYINARSKYVKKTSCP